MLRAVLVLLIATACSPPPATTLREPRRAGLEYPVDPLPPDVAAHLGPGPEPGDFEAVDTLLESAEPEMVRLRRSMTPIIIQVSNVPEDQIVWTLLSFGGAPASAPTDDNTRWIARRVRKLWDGRTVTDWADSQNCAGIHEALTSVTQLTAPAIEEPEYRRTKARHSKSSIAFERQFSLWTTWAEGNDLRFAGGPDSEVGQWAIGVAIALQPCWSAAAPLTR